MNQFKDWAFYVTNTFFYYLDYDRMTIEQRNTMQMGMAAFGGNAPTYHIALYERPRKNQISVDSLCEGVHELAPQSQLQFTITYDPQQIKLHIETQGAILTDAQADLEDTPGSTFGVTQMILNNMFDTVSIKNNGGVLVVDLGADL